MDPNNKEALKSKGHFLNFKGKYAEAITYFDKVLAMDPNNTEAKTLKDLALKG
jgi:tetratricopeptide (TPR) repeat protein